MDPPLSGGKARFAIQVEGLVYEIIFGGQKYDFIMAIKDLGKGRHNVECGQRQGGKEVNRIGGMSTAIQTSLKSSE